MTTQPAADARPAQQSLSPSSIARLQRGLRGRLLQPGDPDYAAARRVFNGAIDRHPALILCCAAVEDVQVGVRFARRHGLPLAVRGGGHSAAGLGVCAGGLVLDLRGLCTVAVDPQRGAARVGGGCTWGEVDAATHPYGLAVPGGIVSSTGVGGLTLGGGHGYLTRQYGLTIDNLRSAEVVLADGSLVTASAAEHDDLFWALRGGGGNFGVVTSFVLAAHPVHTVVGGPMFWPLEQAGEVMRRHRDFLAAAPPPVYGWLGTLTLPAAAPYPRALQGQQVCTIVWCINLPAAQAAATLQPWRQQLRPLLDLVRPLPLPTLNCMFDALHPAGLHWHWRGDLFNTLHDRAIDLHLKYSRQFPTPLAAMHLYPIDGAAAVIGSGESAWSHRGCRFSQVIMGAAVERGAAANVARWAGDYWLALHPYSAGAAYVNFLGAEGPERVQASYGANYARLQQIKAKYDPHNLLRVNQNIIPAGKDGKL